MAYIPEKYRHGTGTAKRGAHWGQASISDSVFLTLFSSVLALSQAGSTHVMEKMAIGRAQLTFGQLPNPAEEFLDHSRHSPWVHSVWSLLSHMPTLVEFSLATPIKY